MCPQKRPQKHTKHLMRCLVCESADEKVHIVTHARTAFRVHRRVVAGLYARVQTKSLSNLEALHGLILGDATSAVRATDGRGVATAHLAPASITPLLGHTAGKKYIYIYNISVASN